MNHWRLSKRRKKSRGGRGDATRGAKKVRSIKYRSVKRRPANKPGVHGKGEAFGKRGGSRRPRELNPTLKKRSFGEDRGAVA